MATRPVSAVELASRRARPFSVERGYVILYHSARGQNADEHATDRYARRPQAAPTTVMAGKWFRARKLSRSPNMQRFTPGTL
jgi:hypothetical protein